MVQEIPPGAQLMWLSAEPPLPENLRFIFHGLIWPDEGVLRERTRTLRDASLRDETVGWIERILKGEWIAPDLRKRLRPATSIVSNQDAFLARYAIDGNRIQIIVTRSFLHVVISPASEYLAWNVPRVIWEFLRVDQPDSQTSWTSQPWSRVALTNFTFGYRPSTTLAGWRDTLSYLSDGRAVKFSIRKVVARDPDFREAPKSYSASTEESERRWFAHVR